MWSWELHAPHEGACFQVRGHGRQEGNGYAYQVAKGVAYLGEEVGKAAFFLPVGGVLAPLVGEGSSVHVVVVVAYEGGSLQGRDPSGGAGGHEREDTALRAAVETCYLLAGSPPQLSTVPLAQWLLSPSQVAAGT